MSEAGPLTLTQLADAIGGRLEGAPADVGVSRLASPASVAAGRDDRGRSRLAKPNASPPF